MHDLASICFNLLWRARDYLKEEKKNIEIKNEEVNGKNTKL